MTQTEIKNHEISKMNIFDTKIWEISQKAATIEKVEKWNITLAKSIKSECVKARWSLDEIRKVIKEPYWNMCELIDEKARNFRQNIEKIEDDIAKKIKTYENDIENEKKAEEIRIQGIIKQIDLCKDFASLDTYLKTLETKDKQKKAIIDAKLKRIEEIKLAEEQKKIERLNLISNFINFKASFIKEIDDFFAELTPSEKITWKEQFENRKKFIEDQEKIKAEQDRVKKEKEQLEKDKKALEEDKKKQEEKEKENKPVYKPAPIPASAPISAKTENITPSENTEITAEEKEKILIEKHCIFLDDLWSWKDYFTTYSEDKSQVFLYKKIDTL